MLAAPRPSLRPTAVSGFDVRNLHHPSVQQASARPSLSASSDFRRVCFSEVGRENMQSVAASQARFVPPSSKAPPALRRPAPAVVKDPTPQVSPVFTAYKPRPATDAQPAYVSQQAEDDKKLKLVAKLWAELVGFVFAMSPVLQQMRSSANASMLEERFLRAWAPSTLHRYLISVLAVFRSLQDLTQADMSLWTQVQIIDAIWAAHRSDASPDFQPVNAIKALRWVRKALQLELPDLYGGLVTVLLAPQVKPHRESFPAPIRLLSFCEVFLLRGQGSLLELCWAGSILLCAWASLRWSDSQRLRWSSFEICANALRCECFRTKTTRRGMPVATISEGFHGMEGNIIFSWIAAWLQALAIVWKRLRAEHDASCVPDCLWFHFCEKTGAFAPLTYAQSLRILRDFAARAGLNAEAVQLSLTLHSLKSSLLHLMHQRSVDKADRLSAGHHRLDSASLYSRDDTVGAMRAQQVVSQAIRGGWLPSSPQRRGAQHSIVQQPILVMDSLPQFVAVDPIWGPVHPACNAEPFPPHHQTTTGSQGTHHADDQDQQPQAAPTCQEDPTTPGGLTSSDSAPNEASQGAAELGTADEVCFLQGPSGVVHLATAAPWGILHEGIYLRPACGTMGKKLRIVPFPTSGVRFCGHSACRKALESCE